MKVLRNSLILVATVFATLLFLEGAVRVALRFHSYYDVEMWKYGTLLKRQAGDPAISHEHVPGARAFLYGTDMRINSKGLRDREFEYAKPTDTYRILFLGDSLTLGWGVDLDKTFSKRLEPMLSADMGRKVEVINTGVGNYNTAQEYAYFHDEGRRYDADRVLLLYFINDAEPTPVFKPTGLIERSMLSVFLWSRVTKLQARLGMRPDFRNYYEDLYRASSPGWLASQSALRHLRNDLRAMNRPLTVFVCPELRKMKPAYLFPEPHRKILSFLAAEGIDFVDLLPRFQSRPEPERDFWVSEEDSHPNALGHQIIAEGVADALRTRGENVKE